MAQRFEFDETMQELVRSSREKMAAHLNAHNTIDDLLKTNVALFAKKKGVGDVPCRISDDGTYLEVQEPPTPPTDKK